MRGEEIQADPTHKFPLPSVSSRNDWWERVAVRGRE